MELKHRITSSPTTGHIPWENHNSKRHMYPNVYCSTIYKARTWKQPECPSRDEWIKKTWCVYSGIWFSHTKEWNWAICRDVDGLRVCHAEWYKKEKNKYCILTHICGIKKNGTDEPIHRTGRETQSHSPLMQCGRWTLANYLMKSHVGKSSIDASVLSKNPL